jgi:hypothetical protein
MISAEDSSSFKSVATMQMLSPSGVYRTAAERWAGTLDIY